MYNTQARELSCSTTKENNKSLMAHIDDGNQNVRVDLHVPIFHIKDFSCLTKEVLGCNAKWIS